MNPYDGHATGLNGDASLLEAVKVQIELCMAAVKAAQTKATHDRTTADLADMYTGLNDLLDDHVVPTIALIDEALAWRERA